MALPTQLVIDIGGPIEVYPTSRPVADASGPRVSVRDDRNNILETATPTLDAVSTTLSAAASIGAISVALASVASIVPGRRYLLGAVGQVEMVRARRISGSTLFLAQRLHYDHAIGDAFVGTRLSHTVATTAVTRFFHGGRAIWTWTGQDAPLVTGLEAGSQQAHNLCTLADVYAVDAELARALSEMDDPQGVLDTAFDDHLMDYGGAFRIRTIVGSEGFTRGTAWKVAVNLAIARREDPERIRLYAERYEEERAKLLATRSADLDHDGVVETHEQPSPLWVGDLRRG